MKQKRPAAEPTTATTGDQAKRLFTYGFASIYGKKPEDLSRQEQHRLNALRLYFGYRHNGFLLVEALDLCASKHCNPPAWVLEGLQEGFTRFGRVGLERALHLTKRDREEYRQYRTEGDVMREVRKAIAADPRRRIAPACLLVGTKHRLNPETLEKQYRRFWKGLFDHIGTN